MLKNFSIKVLLATVLSCLAVIMIALGAAGLYGLQRTNAGMRDMYEQRLIVLSHLDQVVRGLNRNQLAISHAAAAGVEDLPEMAESLDRERSQVDAHWARYMQSRLSARERELATHFDTEVKHYRTTALGPSIAAGRARDLPTLNRLITGPLDLDFRPVRALINELIQLQLDEGKTDFNDAEASYRMLRLVVGSLLSLGAALAIGMGLWLIRAITHPLEKAVQVAQQVAAGDITQSIEVDSANETGRLLRALQHMSTSLTSIVTDVRRATETIHTASGEIASGNLDLSSRTEQQASSLQETASSMEELTSTVQRNADNAERARTLAAEASAVAERGGVIVDDVVQRMEAIQAASSKINDIIGVIDGIAFQTNILALNAAVEAARAGEQGRGFAVVASEVRNLAQRAATASREIAELINASVAQIRAGSTSASQAGNTMREVVDSVQRVSAIVTEISEASSEQRAGIEQVNAAILHIDSVTQQNAALVEQAAAAANAMQEQAGLLARSVAVFKLEADPGNRARMLPALAPA